MGLYREEAVVLRTYRLGEADRILVLMTAGRGKVRAVAKGVRKTGSRFGGRLEPGCHVRLLLYEGRQLDVVNQADSVEQIRGLRDDLTRLRDALALLEAVDQVAQEGESNRALFDMLVGALRTLGRAASPLLVAGFYWKLLALEGSAPLLDECVRCGRPVAGAGGLARPGGHDRPDRPDGLESADATADATDGVEVVALDPVEGGVICRVCQPVGGGRRSLTPAALDLIRQILGGGLCAALATPAGPVAAEVTDLATVALESHLERRLRVPRLLERHD